MRCGTVLTAAMNQQAMNRKPSTDPRDYRHHESYRVRYDDLDTYRHMNNKSFLRLVEDSRVRYLRDVVEFEHHRSSEIGFMMVHQCIDYIAQVLAFDTVRSYTAVIRIGTSSIEFHNLMAVERDDALEPVAVSSAIVVCRHPTEDRTIPVPAEVVSSIEAHEGTSVRHRPQAT